MRKLALLCCLPLLALAACATDGIGGLPPPGGAPPAATSCGPQATADSKGICLAFRTFDVALSAVDALKAAGVVKPGTPAALTIQKGIREVQADLNDASAIQKGVRSGDYAATIARALAAIDRLRVAITATTHSNGDPK
jgi:hypothetical protein